MSSSLHGDLHQAPTLPQTSPTLFSSTTLQKPLAPTPLLFPTCTLKPPACTPSALHPDPTPPYKYPPQTPLLSSPIVSTTMKPITITLFLLIASAAAFASEEDASESTCTREIYRHPLDKYCRSFMMHGRRGGSQGEIMMVNDEDDDSEGPPGDCCNQLRRMKEECRCPAVRHMMREIMQEEGKGSVEECRGGRCGEMMMRGRFLPAMCGMEPRTCRMRQSGNGY